MIALKLPRGSDANHAAGNLYGLRIAAGLERSPVGTGLGVVIIHGTVAQQDGYRLAVAANADRIADLDGTFEGSGGGVQAMNGGRIFHDGGDAVGVSDAAHGKTKSRDASQEGVTSFHGFGSFFVSGPFPHRFRQRGAS